MDGVASVLSNGNTKVQPPPTRAAAVYDINSILIIHCNPSICFPTYSFSRCKCTVWQRTRSSTTGRHGPGPCTTVDLTCIWTLHVALCNYVGMCTSSVISIWQQHLFVSVAISSSSFLYAVDTCNTQCSNASEIDCTYSEFHKCWKIRRCVNLLHRDKRLRI